MDPFTLIATGAGVLGSLISSSQQERAAKEAALVQQDAAARAGQASAAGADQAAGVLAPYSQEGAQARTFVNSALGLQNPVATAGAAQTGPGHADYAAYQQNPDLQAEWAHLQSKGLKATAQFGGDPIAYAKWQYENQGQPTGRTLPGFDASGQRLPDPNAAPTQTPEQANTAASSALVASPFVKQAEDYSSSLNKAADQYESDIWSPVGGKTSYEDSPWSGIATRATDTANRNFLSLAGHDGNVLSSRTARGLQENEAKINDASFGDYLSNFNTNVGNVNAVRSNALGSGDTAKTNALGSYYNLLTGTADTGFNADTNIANIFSGKGSAGANAITMGGNALAGGVTGAADAKTAGMQGAFNSLLYGAGIANGATKPTTPTANPLMASATSNATPGLFYNTPDIFKKMKTNVLGAHG